MHTKIEKYIGPKSECIGPQNFNPLPFLSVSFIRVIRKENLPRPVVNDRDWQLGNCPLNPQS